MEHSATYIAIQDMIQHGLLGMLLSDFAKTLMILEDKGLLTEAEHEALLALADGMKETQGIHSWPPKPGPYYPISGEIDSSS